MKTLIILTFIFVNMINAQSIDTVFNINDNPNIYVIDQGNPYVNAEAVAAEYKTIKKFIRTVKDPLDDEFWPKTPGPLWENDYRCHLITLNNKGEYNLFVVDKITYDATYIGEYFTFGVWMNFGTIFSDLGKFDKKEIAKFYNFK